MVWIYNIATVTKDTISAGMRGSIIRVVTRNIATLMMRFTYGSEGDWR